MGSLYRAACPQCAYFEELYEGSGFAAAVMTPMLCRSCQRVVSVQTTPADPDWLERQGQMPGDEELNQCPHCRGTELEGWGVFQPESAVRAGSCPDCGSRVDIEAAGIWD